MISDSIIDYWHLYKDIIVWGCLYLCGTLYLYFLGFKSDWHEMRVNRGLVGSEIKIPPRSGSKCVFGILNYNSCCKKLLS